MGRGDKKTRKGKIFAASFGNTRPTQQRIRRKKKKATKGR